MQPKKTIKTAVMTIFFRCPDVIRTSASHASAEKATTVTVTVTERHHRDKSSTDGQPPDARRTAPRKPSPRKPLLRKPLPENRSPKTALRKPLLRKSLLRKPLLRKPLPGNSYPRNLFRKQSNRHPVTSPNRHPSAKEPSQAFLPNLKFKLPTERKQKDAPRLNADTKRRNKTKLTAKIRENR